MAPADSIPQLYAGILRYEFSTAAPSLAASAEGTVLELGPGMGNYIPIFDQTKVNHIYGVEINGSFIPELEAKVEECKLSDKYTIIHSGIEDTDVLEKHGIKAGSIDTVVSLQVFCSAAQPEAVAKELYRLLKPGGKLIFWEHSRSRDPATRVAQNIWNFPWRFFMGGCNMNRDILQIIKSAGLWEGIESLEEDKNLPPWAMMPRIWGTLVKPSN
ncbi:hypothetical protein M426DRAFT_265210 [Hypoxylon sp. CI-4A]|nr:hypothetical protein M426DRAFT_265210 [Hypoxylon sp. CI-4A]